MLLSFVLTGACLSGALAGPQISRNDGGGIYSGGVASAVEKRSGDELPVDCFLDGRVGAIPLQVDGIIKARNPKCKAAPRVNEMILEGQGWPKPNPTRTIPGDSKEFADTSGADRQCNVYVIYSESDGGEYAAFVRDSANAPMGGVGRRRRKPGEVSISFQTGGFRMDINDDSSYQPENLHFNWQIPVGYLPVEFDSKGNSRCDFGQIKERTKSSLYGLRYWKCGFTCASVKGPL